MNDRFEQLDDDEVISTPVTFLNLPTTFKVSELTQELSSYLDDKIANKLFYAALDVQVLKLDAKGWKNGKIRLSLKFCPDEPAFEETASSRELKLVHPESPLDDIRRAMPSNI